MEALWHKIVMAKFYSSFKNLTNLIKSDIFLAILCKQQKVTERCLSLPAVSVTLVYSFFDNAPLHPVVQIHNKVTVVPLSHLKLR